jgi:hypothetical protein
MKVLKYIEHSLYSALITTLLIVGYTGNAIAEEKLCIEVTVEHSAGIFEEDGIDEHACTGKQIAHIEFQTKQSGDAGARIEERKLPDITVRWYAKRFSQVEYTLKVWIEE